MSEKKPAGKKTSPKQKPKKPSLAATKSPSPAATYSGFVAIIGAPNAGKSTLLNQLIGQKVSIVSPKAQTTRMRTLGILTEGAAQINFIDTPGIFTAKRRLDRAMVQTAWASLEDADATMLLIDAARASSDENETVIAALKKRGQKIILALNKVDMVAKDKLLPLAARLNDLGIFSDIFMISALSGDGVEGLKNHLITLMPPSPWYYDEDQITDVPTQVMAAEITREQLFLQLQQELPYAAAVVPDSLEEKRDGSVIIRQTILVARDGHRSIILGKGGAHIKRIGERARKQLAQLFDRKVHLFLDVKTDEKWQDRPDFYKTFGLEFGKK